VRRVSVVGNSGSGKSHLAARLAEVLSVPHVELDALYHLAGWQPADPDELLGQITAVVATDGWVIDGNYRTVVAEGPVWRCADTVVWLDLPRATVMRQITARTLRRMVRREELWNGNREPLSNLWSWDPDRSVIRWAWTQHHEYQARYRSAMDSPTYRHLTFVHLRSHAEADRWLQDVRPQPR